MLANPDESLVTGAPVRAFLLGGRRTGGDDLARSAGVSHKARIPVAGVPMAVRVVHALEGCAAIDQIWLCIDDPELAEHPEIRRALGRGRLRIVEPAESPSASVRALLDAMDAPQPVLVTTADHPLLDPTMLGHFLEAAAQRNADVVAGMVAETTLRARYPDVQRTFVSLRGERLTGANLFLLRTPRASRAVDFWQRMETDRKRPWRLASRIGAGSLALYALGRLDLESAMRRLSHKVGARAEVLTLPFAECALDVDRPEHLALAERILLERRDLPPNVTP